MRVLTLHQPWAALVAAGAKTIETRGQPTRLRERIAIHAAARSTHRKVDLDGLTLGPWRVFVDGTYAWAEHYAAGIGGCPWGDDGYLPLHFGAIIATAELYDCVPIIDHVECGPFLDKPPHVCTAPPDALYLHHPIRGPFSEVTSEVAHHAERLVGDYTPGRWAWLLRDVVPFLSPVPFTGGQMWSRTWDPNSTTTTTTKG